MFWRQMLIFVLTVGGIGILAHVVGEALPRRWFSPESWPFRPYAFERGGAIYQKLHIQCWKTRLPDKSVVVKRCEKKRIEGERTGGHMERLARETCVAEAVHVALMVISPVLLAVMDPPYGWICTILYGLSNVPFILIQRYNRPRLMRLCSRFKTDGTVATPSAPAMNHMMGKEELA